MRYLASTSSAARTTPQPAWSATRSDACWPSRASCASDPTPRRACSRPSSPSSRVVTRWSSTPCKPGSSTGISCLERTNPPRHKTIAHRPVLVLVGDVQDAGVQSLVDGALWPCVCCPNLRRSSTAATTWRRSTRGAAPQGSLSAALTLGVRRGLIATAGTVSALRHWECISRSSPDVPEMSEHDGRAGARRPSES